MKRIADATKAEPAAPGGPRRSSTEQILRAAEATFARNGFVGTTMTAISETAGLPKANLHYYFGNKEQLYQALIENILAGWLQDSDVWIVSERSARAGLEGYIRAKMAWSQARSDASRIFAGELLAGGHHIKRYLDVEVRGYVERMDAVFRHWIADGQMRPVSTAHLLFCIWAMTQSYADFSPQMEAVLGREQGLTSRDFSDGTSMILDLVLHGLLVGETPA